MRALVQRVSRAKVTIQSGVDAGTVTGEIGVGLVALVGVTHGDGLGEARSLAAKLWHLRVFDGAGDDGAPTEVSVSAVGGAVLIVSQFTLYGDTRKGRRPTWVDAARPEHAEPLIDLVCDELRALGATVATGRFRADMAVELVNDGPITLLIEV